MSLNQFDSTQLVEFKGSKRGIIVNIKKRAPFDEIRQGIIDRLETSIGFFNGAKIYAINCDCLTDIQIMEIKEDILSRFDVEFIEEEHIKINNNKVSTKYVNNLRSGENIEFDGDVIVMTDMKSGSQISSTSNVVIMGNVSSGARVVAHGNVIVMGSVKGFIHAGANGNEHAYAVAKDLAPKVLQIAGNIAEAPDDDYEQEKECGPEIAFVSEGTMVIESYLPKSIK